jgi:hypothetical protein
MKEILADNDYVKIEKFYNVILMEWKTDLVELDLVKKMVDLRLQVTPEKPYLFVINATKVKKFSKEARDFLAGKKAAERVIAAAIIMDSMITTALANFFLRVSKPEVTTKLFTDEEDAIKWLKKIKIKKD